MTGEHIGPPLRRVLGYMPSCGSQNILRHNALNILTAAPKTSRFIAHRARFDVFAHPSFPLEMPPSPQGKGFKALRETERSRPFPTLDSMITADGTGFALIHRAAGAVPLPPREGFKTLRETERSAKAYLPPAKSKIWGVR